jgi:D-alanine--poly(phosphoribitol) ligase subunit 1
MESAICSAVALAIHQKINRTATPYPSGSSMQELFEYWAGRRPDALAAIQDDREISYRELNQLRASACAGAYAPTTSETPPETP